MLVWNVKRYDCNADIIRDYNVLKNIELDIKHFKKICDNKIEFSEALKREFRWRYWSKAEHELIIELVGNRVILKPWCGCRDPINASIEVTDDPSFDWLGFADYHIDNREKAKIDVWDQLSWKWEALVDYCWHTRLPYQRKHPKFER